MTAMIKNVSNNVIDNYIERVTELSQSSQHIPTTEELETIAAELGIDPQEIQAAQKQSHDHFIRAQGYMRLKHWDDAIAELQEAVVFNPSNLDMLLGLAMAHLGRWDIKHSKEDENNIRLRIRQCLAIKPDCEDALNLLSRLSNAVQWRNRILAGVAVVFGGVIIGVGGFFFFNDGLPNPFQKQSKLELLEQRMTAEIATLRQQQQAFSQQILANQTNNEQLNQRNLDELQSRFNKLETQLQELEKKVQQIEQSSNQNSPLPPN
ncbi:tetratricopeptide repeat protein [Aphanothece sacrum]|uniref:Tetratricopeptide repeat domain protein n=1 Tax=Aphanothece sacrum FPU1 TaxID=1920663 RepID=A0A401IFM3_APHSA|nr:tetratricopeptide repeat protein [Aphanothece sacrum]GBF80021.1 tetratricopeptide repeat domain protein [Aphanothece sacrum FPU1]GBF84563.1 tetratricopeptide repeat protein [Aphanothece sacrum FPU3]